jgi:hypothetical protein
MVIVAARNQSSEELMDEEVCAHLGSAVVLDDRRAAKVVFVGYAVWRREENGDGNLSDEQVWVVRDGKVRLLDPRNDLMDHSPDGVSWGYAGSGPAQLALAMLMEVLDNWPRVQRIYQLFKDRFVAQIPQNRNWIAEGARVLTIARGIEAILKDQKAEQRKSKAPSAPK